LNFVLESEDAGRLETMDTDIIIIGAGLAGLTAARELEQANEKVVVLEKESHIGGRMATLEFESGRADYGAQFFTARTSTFQKQIDEWHDNGLIKVWSHSWSDGSLKRTLADGHPRYLASNGMACLTQNYASSLSDLRLGVKVNMIHWQKDHWLISYNEDQSLTGRVLIMTAPVPQSLALLRDVLLTDSDKQVLKGIHYRACLTGLFVIEGEIELPEPGAIQDVNESIMWIADNRAKGISPNQCVVTVQAEANYSHQHYDSPAQEVLEMMATYLRPYLAEGTRIKESQLKKWRYSLPLTTHPYDVFKAWNLPLIFAGDAFGGRGRIEGAYLSGLAAGQSAKDV
jgi:hypothetical protein